MIDLEQFKTLDPVDVSDEKMAYFKKELLIMHDELVDAWTDEVKLYDTEDFDPYSFFGERKLKKIAKKHAGKIAEVDLLIGVIDDEMSRREKYYEEQRYSGNGKVKQSFDGSDEEFLKREQEKTDSIRKIYEDDDDEI